jgi:hypothetical protein
MDKQAPLPMATLTLNPCLDVSYEFSRLMPDQKVRANHTRFDPGSFTYAFLEGKEMPAFKASKKCDRK